MSIGQEWPSERDVKSRFFLTHTKAELFQAARERDLMIHPVSTIGDVVANPQLHARNFFVELDHNEMGTMITYPGPFFQATETPYRLNRRAPLIGEHNEDIYLSELGLSAEEMARLAETRVI